MTGDDTRAAAQTVKLLLKSAPGASPAGEPLSRDLVLPGSATIREVKEWVQSTWPGRPNADGIRCVHSGRIVQDDETVRLLDAAVGARRGTLLTSVRPCAAAYRGPP